MRQRIPLQVDFIMMHQGNFLGCYGVEVYERPFAAHKLHAASVARHKPRLCCPIRIACGSLRLHFWSPDKVTKVTRKGTKRRARS